MADSSREHVTSMSDDKSIGHTFEDAPKPAEFRDGDTEVGDPTEQQSSGGLTESDATYPKGAVVALVMLSLYLSTFLMAIDRTIIATAIPSITNEFGSLGDVGWYGSAYLLSGCGFQLLFGKIYQLYSVKWVFLTATLLFEVGSAICGAAPTSVAFIVGRAVAGLGSGGIYAGALIIVVHTIPLRRRSTFTSSFAAIFGLASVVGPLLGGTLAQRVSWRWCFYLNLPIGAVTIGIIAVILKVDKLEETSLPTAEKLRRLDSVGTIFFLSSITSLLLALQWGGLTYAWSNSRIIALLVLFPLLMLCFLADQVIRQENATVPPRVFMQRSILAGAVYIFGAGAAMIIFVYYLPIYFQAIQGVGAVESGIHNLPLILCLVIASIFSGVLVTAIGYYTPFMIIGSIVMSVGAGMITTLTPISGASMWIGYQVIFGLGLGLGLQQSNLAAQTVLDRRDVSIGASIMVLGQNLGGAIFLSVAQNILDSKLVAGLTPLGNIDPVTVVGSGTTDIRNLVPPQLVPQVTELYNTAIQETFFVGLATACCTIVGALYMEWTNVKKDNSKQPAKGITDDKAGQLGA